MRFPTEDEFFDVLEWSVVDRAFTFLGAKAAVMCEDCLARALAHTLVTVLFPVVREELARPRRSYDEITRIVDSAVLMALIASLD